MATNMYNMEKGSKKEGSSGKTKRERGRQENKIKMKVMKWWPWCYPCLRGSLPFCPASSSWAGKDGTSPQAPQGLATTAHLVGMQFAPFISYHRAQLP